MSGTGSKPLDHDLGGRVDQVVDRRPAEGRIVGTVILVARHGETLYSRTAGLGHAVGLGQREASKPMTENAIFRLASVTKPAVGHGQRRRQLTATAACRAR